MSSVPKIEALIKQSSFLIISSTANDHIIKIIFIGIEAITYRENAYLFIVSNFLTTERFGQLLISQYLEQPWLVRGWRILHSFCYGYDNRLAIRTEKESIINHLTHPLNSTFIAFLQGYIAYHRWHTSMAFQAWDSAISQKQFSA